ncbi:MAG: toll/interleukin-1 receptor domain-containing protein [Bryobacteraceae bacterium]|jgi:hypothetical protein
MFIPRDVQRWFDEAGFRNHCFVSYAHTGDTRMTDFARRFAARISEEVLYRFNEGKVYFDENIPPGVEWPDDLKENLRCSVSMVAILAPCYLDHEWCGREWAAMDQLGLARLPGTAVKPIIPVHFRKTALPSFANTRQAIYLTPESARPRFYSTNKFMEAATAIAEQTWEIACMLRENQCHAEVRDFQFPEVSAFADWNAPPQAAPFR